MAVGGGEDGGNGKVVERIEKDIRLFKESVEGFDASKCSKKEAEVVELSKMYASDSRSFLDKGDLFTSFASIAYAHGLLDAIKAIRK